MTSSPARRTATSSPLLSSRSLMSRLRAPLQSKTRNFTDFYIQPDDPHRQYAPGDVISGSVIVKVIKPLRITHLVISLHGYAQVFKNPNSPGDAYKNYSTTVGLGKGKKGGSYFGNGFVSLFEDEAVLCGEGRLGEGVYHFNFELEFPSKGLPSSIDFERGTISYMLTSTLTRPTTISPTSSCDTKVSLMEVIDVAPIPEPKPRVISLEPISRRARTKPPRRRSPAQDSGQKASESAGSTKSGRVEELNTVTGEGDGPESPAPSDTSFESRISSGNASGTEYGIRSVHTALEVSSTSGSKQTLKGKTITATIEVRKGGFLRGDQIPITISVDHTKHVRSLKGIIITLYRQARVDMHPALPVAPNSKGDKTKSEDYYPKSRTGLGGLSLSSAGSSHLFRKDLSQSFAPLFIDPRTLMAEVKCAVRVPDDVFPTISNVPGAMISFRYFVEVVVDIQGKLSGLDRMLPNAGLVNVPTEYGSPAMRLAEDPAGSMFSTWGGTFADTDAIRREKGVVSCLFEVVIGTKDSSRNGKQRQQYREPKTETQPNVHEFPLSQNDDPHASSGQDQENYAYGRQDQYYDEYGYEGAYDDAPGYHDSSTPHPPYRSPPGNEEGLSEKEQIQRAEARLLPSQPPGGDDGPSSSPAAQHGIPPSAPVLLEDDEPYPPYFAPGPSAAAPASVSSSQPPPPFPAPAPSTSRPLTAPSIQRRRTDDDSRRTTTTATIGASLTINVNPRQSPPSGNDLHGSKPLPALPLASPAPVPNYSLSSSSHVQPTDDKQELQRRRLELEASAPPGDGAEAGPSLQGPSAPPLPGIQSLALAPSAPVLDDDDEGLVEAVRPARSRQSDEQGTGEELPEYKR